jgi:hypothetical protein
MRKLEIGWGWEFTTEDAEGAEKNMGEEKSARLGRRPLHREKQEQMQDDGVKPLQGNSVSRGETPRAKTARGHPLFVRRG